MTDPNAPKLCLKHVVAALVIAMSLRVSAQADESSVDAGGGSAQPVSAGPPASDGAPSKVAPYRASYGEEKPPFADPERPDMLVIEHAYPENSLQFKFRRAAAVDNGTARKTEFAVEGNLVLSEYTFISLAVPYVFRDELGGPSTSGFGDLEVGLRYILYAYTPPSTGGQRGTFGARTGEIASGLATRQQISRVDSKGATYIVEAPYEGAKFFLTAGLNVTTPTGDQNRGLGEGHTNLEPDLLLYSEIAPFTALQGELSIEVPVSGTEGDDILHYKLGVGRALESTKCWPLLHWVTPMFEFDGQTALDGPNRNRAVVNFAAGFFWEFAPHTFGNIGYNFPVTRQRDFENRLLFSLVHDF